MSKISRASFSFSLVLFLIGCSGGSGNISGNAIGGSGGTTPPSTANEWTWVNGSTDANAVGVYGIEGVASATNMPGPRYYASSWTDANGNLWLFGGISTNPAHTLVPLNDLWEFSTSAKEWTWASGSNSPNAQGVYGTIGVSDSANVPGARSSAASWIDSIGDLWLFGGNDGNGNILNDLWEFNPASKQWTWMGGSTTGYAPGVYGTLGVSAPSNVPGARENAAGWTDKSGNLWLFGGLSGSGGLDDVWEFSTTSKQWTWISGSNTTNELPVFGSLGVAATSNTPGARTDEVIWSDNSGNVWMFGGSMDGDLFNDLWKYNLSQKEWTWVGGSNHMQGPGVYGTQGMPAASNIPGARVDAVGWTDSSGDFWLFGGAGYASAGNGGMPNEGTLEDLWRFDPSSSQWTWMGGSTAVNKSAIYGTKGTPSESNTPGGLYSATSWTDGNGNFWLFGGATLGLSPVPNVLWRYQR